MKKKKGEEEAATWVGVEELRRWEENPRKNKAAISHVAESIERFGFASPIIARAEDNMIIAGHTRYEAALKLGLQSVPVRYMNLSKADSKLLALADNKTAEIAEWDEEELEKVLQSLVDEGHDVEGLGWSEQELEELIELSEPAERDEAPPPEVREDEEPISQRGEIYRLGEHVLICGDWREEALRKKAFDILNPTAGIHDPPYGISAVGVQKDNHKGSIGGGGAFGSGKNKKGKFIEAKKYIPIHEDDKPFNPTQLIEVLPASILWGANHFSSHLEDTRGWIVWDKKTKEWENNTFSDGELAWTPFDRTLKIYRHLWMGIARTGNTKVEYKRVHPTQKPVALITQIIKDYLNEHKVISDFFLGSGTTLIACSEVKKKCIGFEIEPLYCDVIRRRWAQYAADNNLDIGDGLDE